MNPMLPNRMLPPAQGGRIWLAGIVLVVLPTLTARAQPYDLVFADGVASRVCVNDGAAGFSCTSVLAEPNQLRALGLNAADLDADADADLLFTGVTEANRICVNDGQGGFACQSIPDARSAFAVAPADLDGDGDVDLAFANSAGSGGSNWYCLQDGALAFTCQDIGTEDYIGYDVQAADFDGDGDADLAYARNGTNRLCLNDGLAGFTCADISAEADFSFGLVAVDLDDDGDADLAFANGLSTFANQLNQVCLNDGSAGFTCSYIQTGASASRDVAAADFDGDGDVDLAYATGGQSNGVCLNDGAATFSCVNVSDEITESLDVAAADYNGDGVPDLAFANYGIPNQVCLTGPSGFVCSDVSPEAAEAQGVIAARVGSTTVADEREPSGSAYELSAPHPNPTTQQTRLVLRVAKAQHVRAEVYDVRGRRLAVLYDAALAPNTPALLTLEPGVWPAGVYLVRVTGEAFTASRKVLLVK